MFRTGIRPGQGFQKFTVLRRQGGLSPNGRHVDSEIPDGDILGILSLASHGEIRQWMGNQNESQDVHHVLFKIIQAGSENRARPADILELGGRRFFIKGVHDPAGLGRFTTYFAEEKEDRQ